MPFYSGPVCAKVRRFIVIEYNLVMGQAPGSRSEAPPFHLYSISSSAQQRTSGCETKSAQRPVSLSDEHR